MASLVYRRKLSQLTIQHCPNRLPARWEQWTSESVQGMSPHDFQLVQVTAAVACMFRCERYCKESRPRKKATAWREVGRV